MALKGAVIPVTAFQQNCALLWEETTGRGVVVVDGVRVGREAVLGADPARGVGAAGFCRCRRQATIGGDHPPAYPRTLAGGSRGLARRGASAGSGGHPPVV